MSKLVYETDGEVFVCVYRADGALADGCMIYAKDLSTDEVYYSVSGSKHYDIFFIKRDVITEIWAELWYSGNLTNKVQVIGDMPIDSTRNIDLFEMTPAPPIELAWTLPPAVVGLISLFCVLFL